MATGRLLMEYLLSAYSTPLLLLKRSMSVIAIYLRSASLLRASAKICFFLSRSSGVLTLVAAIAGETAAQQVACVQKFVLETLLV
jgi:hypothetical protein